jgi:hypothetical protein
VHQVGFRYKDYQDARSAKHKYAIICKVHPDFRRFRMLKEFILGSNNYSILVIVITIHSELR